MVSTRLQSMTGGDSEGSSRAVRHGNSPHVSNDLTPYTPNHTSPIPSQPYVSTTHFLEIPFESLEKISSYLGYKQVSQLRLVCKQMDRVCSAILNSTFQKLQTQMSHRFQAIKAKMPRRESARRNHPLACESDIIETVDMRLQLLQLTLGKHIERKHICFFPGEILDEVYRILSHIKVTPKLARPYKMTDELCDLSTMAMEYFKEHIEPTLPEIIAYFGTDFIELAATSNKFLSLDSLSHLPHGIINDIDSPTTAQSDDPRVPQQRNMFLRKRLRKIKQGMQRYDYQISQMRKELRSFRAKFADQQKQNVESATRLEEYNKKTEETNSKFSTMLQELNKCKTELQYWRSKSPHTSVCGCCGHVVGSLPDPSEIKALNNPEVVLLPELESESVFAGPSTSSADVWNLADQNTPKQRNKRKSSSAEKTTPASGGPPPAKKQVVLKSRTKRI